VSAAAFDALARVPADDDPVRSELVPVRAPLRVDLDDLPAHSGEYAIRGLTGEAPMAALNFVFDGPPGPDMPRLVEVEDDDGRGVTVGEGKQTGTPVTD
jgi:hypothetical protein